jgi:pimeloyl-ACP methyl ester carboxylesterase
MATFGLVHGAWHGAWCWDRLIPELEGHGHAVIAVELPAEDPAADCAAYAQVVLEQTAAAGDDLVLVGHSLGGLTIPLVAAARPARKLVFVCALLPLPGMSLIEQLVREPETFAPGFGAGLARDELDRSYWADEDAAAESLYADCPRQLATWAVGRLRHQGRPPNTEPCPLEQWPAVESVSLFASDDAVMNPRWSRTVALERLGVNAIELPGGHSPFLSRPAELAEALVSVSL